MKKRILTIAAIALISSTAFAQGKVGVNTTNPRTTFHVDGRSSAITTNNATGDPTAAQMVDDLVVNTKGYIGVGTTTPISRIEVVNDNQGTNFEDDIIISSYNETSSPSPMFISRSSRGSYNTPINLLNGDGLGGFLLWGRVNNTWSSCAGIVGTYTGNGNNNSGMIQLLTSGTTAVTINENQNVGIGITVPKTRLHVAGDITANGAFRSSTNTIQATLPDYVFQKHFTGASSLKPSYRFMPLHEVEAFTKANHHLPGYKSAAEVQKDGSIDISQNTLTNMEKIEELFLHAIEMEKTLRQAQGALRQAQDDNAEMKTALRQAQGDNEKLKMKMDAQQNSIAELLKRVDQLEKNK